MGKLTPYKVHNVMEGLRQEILRGPHPYPEEMQFASPMTPEQEEALQKAYDEFLREVGEMVREAWILTYNVPDFTKSLGENFVAVAKAKKYELLALDDDAGL